MKFFSRKADEEIEDPGRDLEWARSIDGMVGIDPMSRIKALEVRVADLECAHKNTEATQVTQYGSFRKCLDCGIKFAKRRP